MIKSVFILLCAVICASRIWIVSCSNCSDEPNQPSDPCIFECIQTFYDKKYCSGCKTGTRSAHVVRNVNETLASLVQYDSIYYNTTSQFLSSAQCHECKSDGTSADGQYERYFKPDELNTFFQYTQNLTVKSYDEENDNLNPFDELYANITQRFDKPKKWCLIAMGIDKVYAEHSKISEKTSDDSNTEASSTSQSETTTIVTTNDSTTDAPTGSTTIEISSNEPSDISTEPSSTPIAEHQETKNKTVIPFLTEAPMPSTTKAPGSSTKKRKGQVKQGTRPDHHYSNSVTIIIASVGILLLLLIITAIVLSIYVNRRKRMEARTDSRTYVFDVHESI